MKLHSKPQIEYHNSTTNYLSYKILQNSIQNTENPTKNTNQAETRCGFERNNDDELISDGI